MISKPYSPQFRLLKPWQFRKFFGVSEGVRLSHCLVFRIPNDLGHFRVGVSIQARVRAVDRNNLKRQIRESFRLNGQSLGSFDYHVVIPRDHSKSIKEDFAFPKKLRADLDLLPQSHFRAPTKRKTERTNAR